MAKVKILGDMLQIKSELTENEVKRAESFAPSALKLIDEDNNEIFGVSIGDAFYSKYGICFCNTDADGKLFMSTNNPCTEHEDAEKEKETIIKKLAPIISKINAVEEQVKACNAALESIENEVRESVEFA